MSARRRRRRHLCRGARRGSVVISTGGTLNATKAITSVGRSVGVRRYTESASSRPHRHSESVAYPIPVAPDCARSAGHCCPVFPGVAANLAAGLPAFAEIPMGFADQVVGAALPGASTATVGLGGAPTAGVGPGAPTGASAPGTDRSRRPAGRGQRTALGRAAATDQLVRARRPDGASRRPTDRRTRARLTQPPPCAPLAIVQRGKRIGRHWSRSGEAPGTTATRRHDGPPTTKDGKHGEQKNATCK
jgi:hypothetical protein